MKYGMLIIVSYAFCISMWANAASYDCSTASGKVEQFICHNTDLSELDEELAKAYRTAINNYKNPKVLREQQHAWLKLVRDRLVGQPYSMEQAYEERIQQLEGDSPLFGKIDEMFECKFDKTEDNKDEYREERLNLMIENGKPVSFYRFASVAPKSEDLRSGFHYLNEFALSDTIPVTAPGFISLQRKDMSATCDVVITKLGTNLRIRTIGCEGYPETSFIDYSFYQNGTNCRPIEPGHS